MRSQDKGLVFENKYNVVKHGWDVFHDWTVNTHGYNLLHQGRVGSEEEDGALYIKTPLTVWILDDAKLQELGYVSL